MQAWTLNRADRPDRWKLYKAAMMEADFAESELHRQEAYLVEDYADRAELCDKAAKDFPEFFSFQRDKVFPSDGHIVTSWGWMQMLKAVSEADGYFLLCPDDYALKRPKSRLVELVEKLGDVKILQLAYHECDHLHFEMDLHFDHTLPRRVQRWERVGRDVWRGTGMGAADIFVASPEGAQLILDYMKAEPYVNVEHILYALDHSLCPSGTYSVIENNMEESGLVEMKKNAWIRHLISEADGKASDLEDYYMVNADDNKPNVQEKDNWKS